MSLSINVTYDSSVTSLQTSDPTLYNEYTGAVQTAVQYYETTIATPITVNISFGWGEIADSPISAGASGESKTYQYITNYTTLYNAVTATDTTSPVQLAAVASLPTTDPTGGATFSIATAEAAALGLQAQNQFTGGSAGLDSSTAWSWNQSSVAPDTEDAVGTLEHEISEVLGRDDQAGVNGDYTLLDMFRYTAADGKDVDPIGAPAAARDEPFVPGYSSNAPSYFSPDGKTVTLLYETPTDVAQGADVGDWAPSVPNDSYADDPDDGADVVSPTDLQEMNVIGYQVVCYCRQTMIGTVNDEIAVEALRVGDMIATRLDNETVFQPVRWIGHRRIDLATHPRPEAVAPVCIQRNAFADNVPHRDLLVSPDHAIFADGVLISARQLINGTTIRPEHGLASVDYYHVELETHGILFAEGLPAESYLNTGNRSFFANASEPLVLHPDLTSETDCPTRETASCCPYVWDEAAVRPIWQRLAERAAALGHPLPVPDTTAEPHLCIVVQDRTLQPLSMQNGRYCFLLPDAVAEVRLVSRAAAPSDVWPWLEDRRSLGIYVEWIRLRCGHDVRDVPVDHPGFSIGWWAVERDRLGLRRWTNGDAVLPLPVMRGPVMLEIRATTGGMEYPLGARKPLRAA